MRQPAGAVAVLLARVTITAIDLVSGLDREAAHMWIGQGFYCLTPFRTVPQWQVQIVTADGTSRDVEIDAGTTGWLPAQQHAGHNIVNTETHVVFVELKDGAGPSGAGLGPAL